MSATNGTATNFRGTRSRPSRLRPAPGLTAALLGVSLCAQAAADDATPDIEGDVPVTLTFAAELGGQPLDCTTRYEGIGAGGASVTATDFRLFVSRVRLLGADGAETPLALDTDGLWQQDDLALLDFEDATGGCSNGTPETNVTVRGRAPAGDYRGVAFDIGVPFASNHGDPTLAASPLNLTAMFWNWRGGYRFLRLDLASASASEDAVAADALAKHAESPMAGPATAASTAKDASAHNADPTVTEASADESGGERAGTGGDAGHDSEGHDGGEQVGDQDAEGHDGGGHGSGGHGDAGRHGGAWAVHIGSTGCTSPSPTTAPDAACAAPNRIEVVLTDIDPAEVTLVVDPAPVLADVDVTSNTAGTSPGCMSAPDDPECTPVLRALGLGGSDAAQALVRGR